MSAMAILSGCVWDGCVCVCVCGGGGGGGGVNGENHDTLWVLSKQVKHLTCLRCQTVKPD